MLFGSSVLPSRFAILGIDLWLDPSSLPLAVPLNSDATGRAALALPIPGEVLVGAVIYSQFLWIKPSAPVPCPPLGLSASNAVRITIQS